MRTAVGAAAVLLLAVAAVGQDRDSAIPPRYGVPANTFAYPQDTPAKALGSAIKAAEAGRFDYLLAHLLDPAAVDARVTERAKDAAAAADQAMRTLRARQKADPLAYTAAERLPDEPAAFAEAVAAEARLRGFRLLAGDARERFANDLSAVKELRRFLREGAVAVQGETARLTVRDDKTRAVLFRKVGDRWYVEDRQQDQPK